jgi:hypothetical protein
MFIPTTGRRTYPSQGTYELLLAHDLELARLGACPIESRWMTPMILRSTSREDAARVLNERATAELFVQFMNKRFCESSSQIRTTALDEVCAREAHDTAVQIVTEGYRKGR